VVDIRDNAKCGTFVAIAVSPDVAWFRIGVGFVIVMDPLDDTTKELFVGCLDIIAGLNNRTLVGPAMCVPLPSLDGRATTAFPVFTTETDFNPEVVDPFDDPILIVVGGA